jgi:hypothetical protein
VNINGLPGSQRLVCYDVPQYPKDAPRKNAAGGDIMKAKFAAIPGCRCGLTRVIAPHQCLSQTCRM